MVYEFNANEKIDLEDASKIIGITNEQFFKIRKKGEVRKMFIVTALDRMANESKPKKIKVKN